MMSGAPGLDAEGEVGGEEDKSDPEFEGEPGGGLAGVRGRGRAAKFTGEDADGSEGGEEPEEREGAVANGELDVAWGRIGVRGIAGGRDVGSGGAGHG